MGFDQTLEIDQNGYLYIWLSNESKEARVWFDDLTITHEEHFVVQATDYGVWGDVIREQKSDIASYRYGYQGQFADKDDETGWNHFELREYDPVVGRWTSVDPKRIGWSPYIGMGNNPVSGTDPDGGGPNDWVKNAEGRYLWVDGAVDQSTTPFGWEYVGCELPADVNPLDILVQIDGALYYQNTTNLFAKVYNYFSDGPKMVEHKLYDAVAERALGEGISYGLGAGAGSLLFRGLKVFSSNGREFMKSVIKNSKSLTPEQNAVKEVIEAEIDKLHNLGAQRDLFREGMLRGERGMAEKFHEASELIMQQEGRVNQYMNDFLKMFE